MGQIKKDILKESDERLRQFERFRYEEIAPVTFPRKNYRGKSYIKINRRDGFGHYVKIPLINADHQKRLMDWRQYMVLVILAESGKDYQSIGMIVPKTIKLKWFEMQIGADLEDYEICRNKILSFG